MDTPSLNHISCHKCMSLNFPFNEFFVTKYSHDMCVSLQFMNEVYKWIVTKNRINYRGYDNIEIDIEEF